jgi:hypothetical protein
MAASSPSLRSVAPEMQTSATITARSGTVGVVQSGALTPRTHVRNVLRYPSTADAVGPSEELRVQDAPEQVPLRTPTPSFGGRRGRPDSNAEDTPEGVDVNADLLHTGTIHVNCPMHGEQRLHGDNGTAPAQTVGGIRGEEEVRGSTSGGGDGTVDAFRTAAGNASPPEVPVEDGNSRTALQQMHTLMQALNPSERAVFLRTHTLVNELQGSNVSEPLQMEVDVNDRKEERVEIVNSLGLIEEGRPTINNASAYVPPAERSPTVPPPGGLLFMNRVNLNSDSAEEACNLEADAVGVHNDGYNEPTGTATETIPQRRHRDATTTETMSQNHGKNVVEEEEDIDKIQAERDRKKRTKELRRELRAIEGQTGRSGKTGAKGECSGMGAGSFEARQLQKRRKKSQKTLTDLEVHDPLGPQWAAVRDVPPVEVNRLGEPSGAFWDHMKPYVFDRGAYIFPWEVNWNRQCQELKARFIFRLRKLYPGPWEAKAVLEHLGNNLRERRNRLKRRFKIYSNPKSVTRPKGCTLQSWDQILKDLKDPKKKAKSELCKLKADERVATGASPFSHWTGRGGYMGIVARFVSRTTFA